MSFFSIIIPLYNKENFIENTLKSVLGQSFTDFELIIVNDGSTDKSEEIVLQFQDSRIRYYSKQNEGVSIARNFGIEMAQSNYITFIDADDFWYPNFLQEMFQNINLYPELKVFSAAIEIETSKNIIPAQYSVQKLSECQIVNYFEASIKESVICTSCAVFDKSVFIEIGNFDRLLKRAEDTDLWIRIGLIYPIVFSWKIQTRYVLDFEGLSKKNEHLVTSYYFEKFYKTEINHPKLKKFLDLNRFSFAIKCKLNNDKTNFDHFYRDINLSNLSLKKRILLQLPLQMLIILIRFNLLLVQIGLSNSIFK